MEKNFVMRMVMEKIKGLNFLLRGLFMRIRLKPCLMKILISW